MEASSGAHSGHPEAKQHFPEHLAMGWERECTEPMAVSGPPGTRGHVAFHSVGRPEGSGAWFFASIAQRKKPRQRRSDLLGNIAWSSGCWLRVALPH